MNKTYSIDFAGRKLTIETGELAQLANGSVMVRYGDTTVLSTATASSEPREGIDFFPLSVDFEERLYSVGKIPGGFIKREGRPSERAVLTSRLIDRSIRPLFPDDFRNDVVVVNTVLSVDQDNSPEFAALIGSSAALSVSDIPFSGPIGGVIIGLIGEEIVINPNAEEREKSSMYITLSGTLQKITMIEAGANEVSDELMLKAIEKGHEEIKKLVEFINGVVSEIGKPDFSYQSNQLPEEIYNDIEKYAYNKMRSAVMAVDKQVRDKNVSAVTEEVINEFGEKYPESEKLFKESIYKLEKKIIREYILNEGKRVDERGLDEIRPLNSRVGVLPRAHGSGLFQR